jgi:hypothetical protein
MLPKKGRKFVCWRSHGKSKRFGFVAALNYKTFIVGQNRNGLTFQCGLKNALARSVEVVTVD